MKELNKILMALAIALLLSMIATTGCGKSAPVAPDPVIVFGCDNSEQLYNMTNDFDVKDKEGLSAKERYTSILEQIMMDQNFSRTIICLFANGVDKVFEDAVSAVEDIYGVIDQMVLKAKREMRKGTLFAPFLNTVTKTCVDNPDKPIAAALLTDGGSNDLKETEAAAARLAACPNFKCLFVGPVLVVDPVANQRIRTWLTTALAPLGDRVVICSDSDIKGHLSEFYQKMKK